MDTAIRNGLAELRAALNQRRLEREQLDLEQERTELQGAEAQSKSHGGSDAAREEEDR